MVIFTTGTGGDEFAEHCWQTQQDYAARIGARWVKLPIEHGHQCHDVAFTALSALPEGAHCLLLEWDIKIKADAPNIFEKLDFDRFHLRPSPAMPGYFNLGVMAGRPSHFARLAAIKRPTAWNKPTGFWEMILNLDMFRSGFEVTPLEPTWNAIGHDGHFIHHIS